MSHTDFINLWPSLTAFSEDIGVKYGTAKAMRRRGSIPAGHWPAMIEKAKARKLKGVTWETLAVAAARSGVAA